MSENQALREIIQYEYRFNTTPEFLCVDEGWQLYDVFLKYLDNGHFVFVPVFRRVVNSRD